MTVSVCLITQGIKPKGDVLEGLAQNSQNLLEIVTDYPLKKDVDIPVKVVEAKGKRGYIRNCLLRNTEGDYILFINSGSAIEEDYVEELLEVQKETEADVVFPNIIYVFKGEESVKNFDDPYNKELSLLSSLEIENYIPEWGILVKKSSLREFKEDMDDYEFYYFLYQNIKRLKLKLSELSYINLHITNTFIDTSFRSYTLKNVLLKNYDWKREIFPHLSWEEHPSLAFATALTLIAEKLEKYYDLFSASVYLKRAQMEFPNTETLKRLINVYTRMGLFDEALSLSKEIEGKESEVKKLKDLVSELEKAMKSHPSEEILKAAFDAISVFEGAPLYNLLGVGMWLAGKKEEAYRFFYKALTMNPFDKDIYFNLSSVAKELGKEEDVKGLLKRLIVEN